jgi:hypothetical protein
MGVGIMVGCAEPPTTPISVTLQQARAGASANAVQASATGGGHYLLQGLYDAKFSFGAVQTGDRDANGHFRVVVDFGGDDGTADFEGTVVCVTSDPVNGRAWVGGVVTRNSSTSPDFQTAIHQPGRDVWFRVVDSGEGTTADADRTSFFGFTGAAGFQTSAAYCAGQPWPDANARTHAVTNGNIQVR